MHKSDKGKQDKLIARFRLNTAFIHKEMVKNGGVPASDSINLRLSLNQLSPDSIHKNAYYNNFQVHLEFTDRCKNVGCSTRLNINQRMTKEQFESYQVGNVCISCVEAMGDNFQEWIKIYQFVTERKMLGIDNYKFGSEHLFGNNKRLAKLSKNANFQQDVYKRNVAGASSNNSVRINPDLINNSSGLSKSVLKQNDDFGIIDNDLGHIDYS